MRKVLWAALGAVVFLAAGCTGLAPSAGQAGGAQSAPTTPAPDKVALGVGFIPSVQFVPLYAGIEQGFFEEEGIDLALEYGFENDYLTLVGTGEYEFMIGSGDQVILGRAQGLPVRYVMNWYTAYPVVLFAKEEAGIRSPADMAGKRIGLPGAYGANYVALRALLEAGGLTEEQIDMQSIGFTQAAAVNEGTVDAAVDYAVNGPVVLALEGIPTTVVDLNGVLTMPANGLVTNEQTIGENPDRVARLVRAMLRSIEWTLANPDEAFAIALEYVPEAGGANERANRAIFDASIPFWTPQEGRMPGATDAAEWAVAAEFMQRAGLAPTVVPADELFTNEFVEE